MTRPALRRKALGPRLAISLALVVTTAARAQEPPSCDGPPGLDGEPVSLAAVKAAGRVPFIKTNQQDRACPSDAASCRDAAYLVAGNAVVVGGRAGRLVCAAYVGAKGGIRTGWLPAAALAIPAETAAKADDWVGSWTSGPEHRIKIRRSGDGLALDGDATYGAQDPDRVKRGAINLGGVAATIRPVGGIAAFTEGSDATLPYEAGDSSSCRVRLRLVGRVLIAEDNRLCGGNGVTFRGYYGRR